MEKTIKLHPKQAEAFESDKRYTAVICGKQSGKTFLGSVWALKKINDFPEKNGLIAAPTYKILNQSTLDKFFSLFPEFRKFYKQQQGIIELPTGGKVYIRSTDEPLGLEGMTLKWAWLDEAGMMNRLVWVIIRARTVIENGQVFITTTPYCFDKETEIYTKQGWKKFSELKEDDLIFVPDKYGRGDFEKPLEIIRQKYKGEMILFNGDRVNMLVTPNHRVLYKNSKRYYVKTAEDFEKIKKRYITIPKVIYPKWKDKEWFILPPVDKTGHLRWGGKWKIKTKEIRIKMSDWCAFMGWFLSEGSVKGSNGGHIFRQQYQVVISQKEGKKRDILREDLKKLPFNFHEVKDGFIITNKQLWSYLKRFGNSKTKYIPDEIKFSGVNNLKILINRMILGDGTYRIDKHGEFVYYTVSERLANDFKEVCMLAGISTKISVRENNNNSLIDGRYIKAKFPIYHISQRKRKGAMIKTEKRVNYNDWVYCVRTSTGFCFVRRNGEEFISGNSINWLYEEFYIPWKEGRDKDLAVYSWRSIDNPYFPKEFYEKEKERLSEKEFARQYLGQFTKMEGLVYELQPHQIIQEKEIKNPEAVIGGIDWGFANPSAIAILVVKDRSFYLVDEFYETEKTTQEIIEKAKSFVEKYKVNYWFPDPAEPDRIEEMKRAGLYVKDVNKDISFGISKVQQLIRENRFFVFNKCKNSIDEFNYYHYDLEKIKDLPVKENDHLMDAIRYAIVGYLSISNYEINYDSMLEILNRRNNPTSFE